jgi:hypothetical protein
MLARLGPKLSRFHGSLQADELVGALVLAAQSKDANILAAWLVLTLSRLPHMRHKRFLVLLGVYLHRVHPLLRRYLGLVGIFIDVRGKLGVSGNAKKRHHSLSLGKLSLSRKTLRISFVQSEVRTLTGALGLTCMLTY